MADIIQFFAGVAMFGGMVAAGVWAGRFFGESGKGGGWWEEQ